MYRVAKMHVVTGWLSRFVSVALSLLLIYLILGIAYNYFVRGQTGWKVLPNSNFWGEAYDFVAELGANIKNRLTSNPGGYQQI